MPLQVLPATEADALEAVFIERLAYGPSSVGKALFPGSSTQTDSDRASKLVSLRREDPASCKWLKVVDTDLSADEAGRGQMVAFANWYVWEKPRKEKAPLALWGPNANVEACQLFFGGMAEKRGRRFKDEPFVYLKLLHTHPDHQRRGAASLLIRWGLAESDRLGIPAYLESSDQGQALYTKHGFLAVDILHVDLSLWGGPEDTATALMLHEPSPEAS